MARGSPAAGAAQQPAQEVIGVSWTGGTASRPLAQASLDLPPVILGDDRVVLAGVDLVAIGHEAGVDRIL